MKYSAFGNKLGANAGIVDMMDNLSHAMVNTNNMIMLGGGNPAYIPELGQVIEDLVLPDLCRNGAFYKLIANYSSPKGDINAASVLAEYLREYCGWDVVADNIFFCNGSQSALFMLLNLVSGRQRGDSYKKVLLPFTPEYIGYEDLFVDGDCIHGNKPRILKTGKNTFKYEVDFDALSSFDDVSCMLVSSPSNPSGRVLEKYEREKLMAMCKAMNIPMIYDNAYGWPYPDIQFTGSEFEYDENMIITMSLSKIGMPGLRSGVVVAKPDIIEKLRCVNAVSQLSPNTISMYVLQKLIETRTINKITNTIIKPFYKDRSERMFDMLEKGFEGYPIYVHQSMGTMFMWIWAEGMPITSEKLYERLKNKGVLTLSGHHFFLGNKENDWRHKEECLRITYSQPFDKVEKATRIIIDELKQIMDSSGST
jgi:valine--pyruvate aminotransferase